MYSQDGSAPLSFAASKGHLDVVRSLLGHGAPVNAVDRNDVSALVAAARAGHLDVVGHLVSGCEWNTGRVTNINLSPFTIAGVLSLVSWCKIIVHSVTFVQELRNKRHLL